MPSDPETPIAADAASMDTLVHAAATLEILQVISRSRDDEEPVFDAILQKAAQLCGHLDDVRFVQADLKRLPFAPASFDFVFSIGLEILVPAHQAAAGIRSDGRVHDGDVRTSGELGK